MQTLFCAARHTRMLEEMHESWYNKPFEILSHHHHESVQVENRSINRKGYVQMILDLYTSLL